MRPEFGGEYVVGERGSGGEEGRSGRVDEKRSERRFAVARSM